MCSSYNQKMELYSQCSLKAKSLFNEICEDLSNRKLSHWKAKKIQNMYCNAAINYEPVIASISNPKKVTENRENEKKCNLLILKRMEDKSPELIAERDLVCAKK